MLNKRGEETSSQFTVGLVLTIIILFGFTSCAYKMFNPNCDPSSIEVFDEFVRYYEGCAAKTGDCGKFDYSKLDKLDNIIVEPNDEKLESTKLSLRCNGKTSFRNNKKIDVRLCFTNDKTNFEYATVDNSLQFSINPDVDSNYETSQYVGAANVELYNFGKQPCFLWRYYKQAELIESKENILRGSLGIGPGVSSTTTFDFNDKEYSIKIEDISITLTNLKLSITPGDIRLSLNVESKTPVDLDKDGINDVEIWIVRIRNEFISVREVPVAYIVISPLSETQNE